MVNIDPYLSFDGTKLMWIIDVKGIKKNSWNLLLGSEGYQKKRTSTIKNKGTLPENLWEVQ